MVDGFKIGDQVCREKAGEENLTVVCVPYALGISDSRCKMGGYVCVDVVYKSRLTT
jgi:hypothetical protein